MVRSILSLSGIVVSLLSIFCFTPSLQSAEIDASGAEFKEARKQYNAIADKYPRIRKQEYAKLLSDFLKSAKQRYQQEKAASNLSGMGVAKEAIKILENAQKEFEETGEFSLPDRIRRQLKDFFNQIRQHKGKIDDKLEKRKKRLRQSAFSRFADLSRKQVPEMDIGLLRQEFEKWLKEGGEEAKQSNASEEKGREKHNPRTTASELGLDIFTDDFKSLHSKFERVSSRLEKQRSQATLDFLKEKENAAREWYAEQKKIRNIKGMAVAGKAVNTLADLQDTLEKKGEFSLPPNEELRNELHDYFDTLRREKKELLSPYNQKEKKLESMVFERFTSLARKQVQNIDTNEVRRVFKGWVDLDYSGTEKNRAKTPTRAAENGDGDSGKETDAVDRLYFAQKGESKEWFKVGEWKVESQGMDIFEVPVYSGKNASGSKRNILSGGSSEWEYTPENDLEENAFYSFRLKRMKGCRPVSVVDWPSLRNQWQLEVRTGKESGKYGFEIQAGQTRGKAGKRRKLISIPMRTEPEGAKVYVDGERYYVPGEQSVTPLKLKLKPDRYDIVLAKDDYLKKKIEDFQAQESARIDYKFKHESDVSGQTIRFSPDKRWKKTKIEMETGDKIWAVPEGSWTCGNKGESVGPGGYSRSEYPHYYEGKDLRKFKGANYGALLMKVGEEYYGAPPEVEDKRAIPIPDRKSVVANTWGELWFDINEREGQQYRFDNRGMMKLKIVVIPKGKVPFAGSEE